MVAAANATADGSFSTTHLRAHRRAAVQLGKHPVHADRESVRSSHSSNNPEDLLGQAQSQVLSLQLMVSCLQSTKAGTKGERLSASDTGPVAQKIFPPSGCSPLT